MINSTSSGRFERTSTTTPCTSNVAAPAHLPGRNGQHFGEVVRGVDPLEVRLPIPHQPAVPAPVAAVGPDPEGERDVEPGTAQEVTERHSSREARAADGMEAKSAFDRIENLLRPLLWLRIAQRRERRLDPPRGQPHQQGHGELGEDGPRHEQRARPRARARGGGTSFQRRPPARCPRAPRAARADPRGSSQAARRTPGRGRRRSRRRCGCRRLAPRSARRPRRA